MIRLFWGVALALHPFIIKISFINGASKGKDHFLLLAVVISALIFGIGKLPKLEGVFFSAIMVLSSLSTIDFYKPGAIYQSIYFGVGLLLLAHFYSKLTEQDIEYLLNITTFVAAISVIYSLISWTGFKINFFVADILARIQGIGELTKQLNWGSDNHPIGPLLNPNHDGAYIAFMIPVLMRGKLLVLAPLFLFGLWLQDSAAAWAASLGVVLYWGWLKRFPSLPLVPFVLAGVAMLAVFGVSFVYDIGHDSGRFLIWKLAFGLTSFKTFLVGNGLGWFHDTFHKFYIINGGLARQEHNEFLAFYFSFGFPMLIMFLCMVVKTIKNCKNDLALMGLFAVFIDSFANFNFHISPLAAVGILYYALALKGAQDDKTLEWQSTN